MTTAIDHEPRPETPARGPELLVEARDVHKTYRLGRVRVPVLRGASLAVERGACIAVLGASGSGKSTLLHLLGGLDRVDRGTGGTIRFEGRPLHDLGPAGMDAYRNRDVGFVFQFYHLLPELTVLENTTLTGLIGTGRLTHFKSRARLRSRATDLLRRFGLGDRLRHKPVELSGGERQRVAIARALLNEPKLLLADEPTGNLDQKTGASILDAMMALRGETGQTMVIVTHDEQTAERADRVVRLEDGVVVGA